MAIWQFDTLLVPGTGSTLPVPFGTSDGFDDSVYWIGKQPRIDVDRLFREVLPQTEAWSDDMTQFGKEEETCFQVWRDGRAISSIRIRLDLRSVDLSILEAVIRICRELDCKLFLVEFRRIVEPDLNLVIDAVQHSSAASYIDNPRKFLLKERVRRHRN